MGQGEIFEILKNKKIPLSASEIIDEMLKTNSDCNVKGVFVLLGKLIKHNEIKYLEIPRGLAMKRYNSKRRMRLYYVIN